MVCNIYSAHSKRTTLSSNSKGVSSNFQNMSPSFIDVILQLLNMLSTSRQSQLKHFYTVVVNIIDLLHAQFFTSFSLNHLLRKQKTLLETSVHWQIAMNVETKIFFILIFTFSSGWKHFSFHSDKICKMIISTMAHAKMNKFIFGSLHK